MRELKDAIRMLAGTHNLDMVMMITCEVVSVNEIDQTVDVKPIGGDKDTIIPDVSLVMDDGDGDTNIPVEGSTVLVTITVNGIAAVVMCSDLDQKFIITQTKTQFNNGLFGGLVKVIDLTQKINALENTLNTLIATFNGHVHTGVSSGGATSGTTATPGPAALVPTVRTEIENTRITHGE